MGQEAQKHPWVLMRVSGGTDGLFREGAGTPGLRVEEERWSPAGDTHGASGTDVRPRVWGEAGMLQEDSFMDSMRCLIRLLQIGKYHPMQVLSPQNLSRLYLCL